MTSRIAILNCYDALCSLFRFKEVNVGEKELLSLRIESFSGIKVDSFDITREEFPEGDYDAYVISGSHCNPDRDSISENPWMRDLLSFIRRFHEKKVPMLGICFGHQMIAVALGAKTFELPEFEVGFKKMVIQDEGKKSPLYASIPEEFFAVFFHKWAVSRNSLPFGSKLLVTSPDIPEQAVSFSIENSYAVQFHPERVSADVQVMIGNRENMFEKGRKFNYKESSNANVMVLENFVKRIANKTKK